MIRICIFCVHAVDFLRPEPHSVRSANFVYLLNKIEQKISLTSRINKQILLDYYSDACEVWNGEYLKFK